MNPLTHRHKQQPDTHTGTYMLYCTSSPLLPQVFKYRPTFTHRCLSWLRNPQCFLSRNISKQSTTKHLHLEYEHGNKEAVPLSDIFIYPRENVEFALKRPKLSPTSEVRGACEDAVTQEADLPVASLRYARRCACHTLTLPVKELRFGHQWKTGPHKHITEMGSALCSHWWPPFFFLFWGLTCGSDTLRQDDFIHNDVFQQVDADTLTLRHASKKKKTGEGLS